MLRLIRTHLPVAIVAVLYVVAVLLVMSDRWRRGALVFGAGTMLAGAARFVLDEDQLGWFAVRGRWFDGTALFVVGGIIVWLAAYIDPLGTG